MPRSRAFVEHVRTLLEGLGPVRARAMFGGWSLSLDGLTFALVADDTLYFKTDAATRGGYEALGRAPFAPDPDRPDRVMAYHHPPETALDDADELIAWAKPALNVARRAAQAKPRRRKVSKPRGTTG